jgi:membrane protein
MNEAPRLSDFLKGLYRVWITERTNQLAAGLAYFGKFSFAPVIYIAFIVAGFFVDAVSIMDRVFVLLYKALPDTDIPCRSVWLGAVTASALMTVGGSLVIWLLGLGMLNTGASAAGAFILILLLIYFIAQIFLLGAIISREYAFAYGSKS